MDRNETLKVLAVLRGAYPNFYKGMSARDANDIAVLWEEMFRDDPYELVGAAVKALIVTDEQGYPPHIGAVKAKLRQITAPKELGETEAWALVKKACSNGIYGAQKEFDKLPPIVQKILGSPSQLRDWALCGSEELDTVIASNFLKAYRREVTRQRDYNALPPDVRALADKLSERMALDGRTQPALTEGAE